MKAIGLLAVASLILGLAPGAGAEVVSLPPGTPADHGLLANPFLLRQPVKSVYFFAGNWRRGFSQHYKGPPLAPHIGPLSDNTALYTQAPFEPRHLGWSEAKAHREFAVDEMLKAKVNTVTM